MKSIYLLFGLMTYLLPLPAQKELNVLTSNLNLSKSNINRLIYPGALSNSTNALLLLKDLEKTNPLDQAAMKTWLVAKFKRFNIDESKVKQILILPLRQYEDCTICKKNCKGKCVQDPGADCVCIQHSEPNLKYSDPVNAGDMPALRNADPGKRGFIISLSQEAMEEEQVIEAIVKTISAQKPVQKN